jgi:prepilin-type N-terminal cleavage/methylation domain-containing protein
MRRSLTAPRNQRGFNLMELIIAVVMLGVGMISVLQMFPRGAEVAVKVRSNAEVAFLAQSIMEMIKADPSGELIYNMRVDPASQSGAYFLGNVLQFVDISGTHSYPMRKLPLPGNGRDDNGYPYEELRDPRKNSIHLDINPNGKKDADYDGSPELDYISNYMGESNPHQNIPGFSRIKDDDQDGALNDNGDSNGDGNIFYDPEPDVDEEYPDGRDNNGNQLIDEDCRLATVILSPQSLVGLSREFIASRALFPGNRLDEDGDGENGSPVDALTGWAKADDYNNNYDEEIAAGAGTFIDEGIDEEVFNNLDDDSDGSIDEDTRMASFPFNPIPFSVPNEDYSWRIFVGVVGSGGDHLNDDNDFDNQTRRPRIDEEILDGLDNDGDGLTDEDVLPHPMQIYRLVRIEITWGGNRIDDDNDGWTDEELSNGLDDDLDGLIDEDIYTQSYSISGVVPVGKRQQR